MVSTVADLSLQLQQVKEQLKATDETIKKVTGRDTIEPPGRGGAPRRDVPPIRGASNRNAFPERSRPSHYDEPSNKRPRVMNSFHPLNPDSGGRQERTRGGWDDYEDDYRRRKVQSTVIVDATPGKTREERISEAAKVIPDKDVARNRRIFGSLMGTLKKFQQEQTTRETIDERQKEIQRKLEEKELEEKQKAQRERRELFWERKKKLAVIKFLETKVDIVKRFEDWEATQKPLMNFIRTSGAQPIFYLARKLNKEQEAKLEATRKLIEEEIAKHRTDMEDQLRRLDDKIEHFNRPVQRGQEGMDIEENIQETRKKMIEEPVDDIDVEALLDDNEIEGLELIAVDDQQTGERLDAVEAGTGIEQVREGEEGKDNGQERVERDVEMAADEQTATS